MFVVFRRSIATTESGPAESNSRALESLATIETPWGVEFDPQRGGPSELLTMEQLQSWSEFRDPQVRYYSGTATYRTNFDLAENAESLAAQRVWLDLGDVENVAAVRLNGSDLGVAWTRPFRVELTGHLQDSGNQLEIEVTNLWPNRLIGDAQRLADARITKTNITKFDGNSPLLPSGLLGPVTVLVEAESASAP
jgi:hypothetical protein